MDIIGPRVKIEFITPNALQLIEKAGRTCYKSEDKITQDSAEKFCNMIRIKNHMSVLEHASASFRITCDRGVSHEIVRHRLASYSQESSRYCCYSPDKKGMRFIYPTWIDVADSEKVSSMIDKVENTQYTVKHILNDDSIDNITKQIYVFLLSCHQAEQNYNALLKLGQTPQQARAVLPNCLKTELVMTANFREWLHFLELRTSPQAHPDMRWIAQAIQTILWGHYPQIFKKAAENV